MTDPLGQSQVLPYLVGLSELGYSISLVSCEKNDRFEVLNVSIQEICTAANIRWLPVSYSSQPSVMGKLLNLYRINKKAIKIGNENTIRVVHCRSYMAALIGLRLKKQFELKFVFDMRGFWADERVDGNIWSHHNYLQRLQYLYFKKKEKAFLANADTVISLTENAKNEMLNWNIPQLKRENITVIPCCVDLKLFCKKNTSEKNNKLLKQNLKIAENDFVLTYLGSIGTWYMLDEMLDFFKCLMQKKASAKFLFITQDSGTEIINKAVNKGIDESKLIIVSANRSQVPQYLSIANFSIYFIKQAYSKKASSPTKTGEIMAMGIPIVTNSGIGDSDKIIRDSNAGILIEGFNENLYNLAIDKMEDVIYNYQTIVSTNATDYFSLERGVKLYNHVYQKLN
jgi:glycosyltransferase involved in cell wall biosynthesis